MDMTCPMGTKLKRPPAFLTQFWHPRSGFDTPGVVLSALKNLLMVKVTFLFHTFPLITGLQWRACATT